MIKKSKILIVDDEPDILLTLGDFLRRLDYRVDTANSGKRVIEKIKENPPDLVLLPDVVSQKICKRKFLINSFKLICR